MPWQNVICGYKVCRLDARHLNVMPDNGGKTGLALKDGMCNQTQIMFSAGECIVPGSSGIGLGVRELPVRGKSGSSWMPIHADTMIETYYLVVIPRPSVQTACYLWASLAFCSRLEG